MKALKRLLLVFFGILLALIAFEFGATYLVDNKGNPLPMGEGTLAQFRFDDKLGFMPRVGEGGEYGPYGCKANDYDPLDKGDKTRLLFIGDSVTNRAKIIDGLKALYGEDGYEYWNAGVESFNTEQSEALFRLHNKDLSPDHVILTFHNNDFQVTPMATKVDGEIVLRLPRLPPVKAPFPWLGRTALYRLWLQYRTPNFERSTEDVKQDLQQIKTLTEQQGAKFSVVLFPILSPLDEWTEKEKRSRAQALAVFEDLELEYYDPFPSMPQDKEAIEALRETPEDPWHPGDECGRKIAQYLYDQGLIKDSSKD